MYIIHEVNSIGELAGILFATVDLDSAKKAFDEIIAAKDEAMRKKIASGYGNYMSDEPYFENYEGEDMIEISELKKKGKQILKYAQSYDYDLILEEFETNIIYLSISDKSWLEEE